VDVLIGGPAKLPAFTRRDEQILNSLADHRANFAR
jgi:hypothetical protein